MIKKQQLRYVPHTSFVAKSSTNFPEVSQSGDDISKYQPPNSENEGFEDHSDIDDIENLMASTPPTAAGTSNDFALAVSQNDDTNDWTNTPDPNPLTFPFIENFELNTDCSTIEKFVDQFFPQEFMELLVEETNSYASQAVDKHRPLRSSRWNSWTSTNVKEMKLSLGLLLQMGQFTLPSSDLPWSTDILHHNIIFSSAMSCNRFQLLLRFFHFADNLRDHGNDKLYEIRPILNHFNATMKTVYVPDKHICIDESIMLWRGRLSFRQYIKNKRHKYGTKLYNLYESNGLILKTKIYTGRGCT